MKKSLLITILIIGAILVASIGIFYFLSEDYGKSNQKDTLSIDKEISLCNELREITERQDCYFQLAVKHGNSVCDMMDGIRASMGGSRPITGYSLMDTDTCYIELASNNRDSGICNLQKTSQDQKDSCIFTYVFKTSDASACDEIITESLKDVCYNVIFTRQAITAIEEDDFYICQNFGSQDKIDECLVNIALFSIKPTLEICKEIKSIDLKDSCYFEVATKNTNQEICDKINSVLKKQDCLKLVDFFSQ